VQLKEVSFMRRGAVGASSESGTARDKFARPEILVRDMKRRVTINAMTHKGGTRRIGVGGGGLQGSKGTLRNPLGKWGER